MLLLLTLLIIVISSLSLKSKDNNFFDINYCNNLKGLCVLLILANHVVAATSSKYCFSNLYLNFGNCTVALFFLISGYGTMYGYLNKKNYFKSFLKNKAIKILFPYLIANLIFLSVRIVSNSFSLNNIFTSFLKGEPLVPFSWYIVTIMYLYITFYISFKQNKINKNVLFLTFCVFYFLIVRYFFSWSSHWYTSFMGFAIGVYLSGLFNKSRKINLIRLGIGGGLFIVQFIIGMFLISTLKNDTDIIYVIVQMLCSVGVCFFIYELSKIINIKSKFLEFLSHYSLEIYLYQGFSIALLRKISLIYNNNILFIFGTYILTIVLAVLIKKVTDYTVKYMRKIV